MDLNRLVDLPPDGHQRVERGHRLLKHHRDLVAAELAQPLPGDAEQVLAIEPDFPSLRPHVRAGQQAHDRPAGEGLARPGLADQAHDLVTSHVETDPFHRKRTVTVFGQAHVQVANGEQRRFGHGAQAVRSVAAGG